ncbi:olfactory receptor 14J1-like [Talpa occidentalis]|uniref:olfactory receptor 14J1-like n=1 Tax=Talpa occidentalis TaxID=50954 RepID=UPI0018906792|nr:olfactory receptor 14J1-like [Talpa occidentalis]
MANFTVNGFLLMGFSAKPEVEILLAFLFLVLYMVAVTGNLLIIMATSMDNNLHSPMYFFLKHLSFLDLCYISATVPRSIYNSFMHSGYISLGECIVQCFAFILCLVAEMSMLTVMSYDRYVAICFPLHYELIMDASKCVHGVLGVWISGVISASMHTAATFSMHFCGYQIHQFFCDVPQVLKLSCSNEYISDIGVTGFVALMTFLCVIFIGLSYIQIFSTEVAKCAAWSLLLGFCCMLERKVPVGCCLPTVIALATLTPIPKIKKVYDGWADKLPHTNCIKPDHSWDCGLTLLGAIPPSLPV